MHRSLTTRRTLTPILTILATASSIAACAPWDLGDDGDYPGLNESNVVVAENAPPAISGGTLLVAHDGVTAVAADPDRDRVWVVDLQAAKLIANIALEPGDEPGRVVEDSAGRFHVALRRGGAIATLDIATGKVAERRDVCPAPRGIAFDPSSDALHVACLGGELVTLPAAGGKATRRLRVDRDLRDVIVDGDHLLISRFRSAELLTIQADGTVSGRSMLPDFQLFGQQFQPSVAWRTVKMPGGGVAMAHQRSMTTPVEIEGDDGYGSGGCDGSIVHSTVSVVGGPVSQGVPMAAAAALPAAILPVDLAVSSDGTKFAVVAAGSNEVILTNPWLLDGGQGFEGEGTCNDGEERDHVEGGPTAVAFAGSAVVVQTREPASLVVLGGPTIKLPGESRMDTGHEMFHTNPEGRSALACASCHPEGRDDGRTWNFNPIGARRTQFISGGILGTAPFHWDGDMAGIDTIMGEVFEHRMGGVHQGPRRVRVFARWIDSLPSLPASTIDDAAAVARGEALFNNEIVACSTCHAGASLTNNKSADVGTGKAFQVPSLIGVVDRAPFMHDGCAATIKDRFTNPTCGGGDAHGKTSQLSPAQIDDLVAYIESL